MVGMSLLWCDDYWLCRCVSRWYVHGERSAGIHLGKSVAVRYRQPRIGEASVRHWWGNSWTWLIAPVVSQSQCWLERGLAYISVRCCFACWNIWSNRFCVVFEWGGRSSPYFSVLVECGKFLQLNRAHVFVVFRLCFAIYKVRHHWGNLRSSRCPSGFPV